MHLFMNMCNLCRYARFSQARSQICLYLLCGTVYWETLASLNFMAHFDEINCNKLNPKSVKLGAY